jgi:hypothetical protein
MPPGPEAFARALARCSRAEFAAFVAALWRARGRDVTVEDGGARLRVVDADGTTERVAVVHDLGLLDRGRAALGFSTRRRSLPRWAPGSAADDDADRVVTSARLADSVRIDADVVDADDLRRTALYALPRATCASLLAEHLSCSLRDDTEHGGVLATRRATLAAVAAAVLVVLVGVAGGVALFDGGPTATAPGDGASASSGVDASAGDDGAPTGAGVATTTTATATPSRPEGYPPGLGRDGVTDADALARAHTLALLQGPYRWSVTYREVVNNTTRGYVRETAVVENASAYRTRVERNGTVESGSVLVADHPVYADGWNEYRRIEANGTVRYERQGLNREVGVRTPLYEHPLRVIQWYLSTEESRVVDVFEDGDSRVFRVRGTGDSWPRTTDARTVAVISDEGVVYYLRRSHRPPDWEGRIVVTFRASRLPGGSVAPPPWYDDARRAVRNGSAV